jgi:FkbM family methyltransferase
MEWDESLRYNYPLNKDSIVFDIGGFEGTWAQGIYSKYLCHIFVFEPVKEFYDIIKSKLQENCEVQIYNYGLGTKNEMISISVNGMSTSILDKAENNKEQVEIKDVLPIISTFTSIDLMKINIEGAEYDLLDYIIGEGFQAKLVNIQIQFHNNVNGYENRRQRIRDELTKTHHLTYDYPYTWENWEINK